MSDFTWDIKTFFYEFIVLIHDILEPNTFVVSTVYFFNTAILIAVLLKSLKQQTHSEGTPL